MFTAAKDEPLFLPLWRDYYRKHFDPEDVFLLSHDTTPSPAGLNVVPIHNAHYGDYGWLAGVAHSFQSFLLKSYEYVLYADVDEFVMACPHRYPGGLRQYIGGVTDEAVKCDGFDLVHADGEPPLDPSLPVLAQRGWMRQSVIYCKPLLARVPLHWIPGFHGAGNADARVDPHLVLMHLHRMDYGLAYARTLKSAAGRWPDDCGGAGYQNRLTDPDTFRRWFYEDFHDGLTLPLQPVPEHWRNAF